MLELRLELVVAAQLLVGVVLAEDARELGRGSRAFQSISVP